MLSEKTMGEYPKKFTLIIGAMEATQQKFSSDVVLFFTCTNHTHQLLPHRLICLKYFPQSSTVFPDVIEEQLADVFSHIFDHQTSTQGLRGTHQVATGLAINII